jgi:hypothetical protein
MKCDHCGKRHWFTAIKISPRYWLQWLRAKPGSMAREYSNFREGNTYTVGTRFHESGGHIYCHGCWWPFLRSIGE